MVSTVLPSIVGTIFGGGFLGFSGLLVPDASFFFEATKKFEKQLIIYENNSNVFVVQKKNRVVICWQLMRLGNVHFFCAVSELAGVGEIS